MATQVQIQQEISRLQALQREEQANIDRIRQQIDSGVTSRQQLINLQRALASAETGVRQYQGEILALQKQLAAAQQTDPAPPPAQSAGQAVQSQQQNNPLETEPPPPSLIPPGASGVAYDDEGNIVSTYDLDGNEIVDDDAGDGNNDEEYEQQAAEGTTDQSAFLKDGVLIKPQPNILDQYPSYTWSASLYVMNDQQYKSYINRPVQNVNSYLLLIQSGGAPANQGGARTDAGSARNLQESAGNQAGRNPYFDKDFTIDNIEITSWSTITRGHGSNLIKFTITETENISFLDRLQAVVQNLKPPSAKNNLNFASTFYLLVIRFYAYDINGKIVQPKSGANRSDSFAIVEKYYPMKLRKVNFKIQNKNVVYDIEAAPHGHEAAGGTALGSIQGDIELTGQTVGDILTGDAEFVALTAPDASPGASTTGASYGAEEVDGSQETPPPPKAQAAKSTVSGLRGGLMGIMTATLQKKQELAKFKLQDRYKLTFAEGAEKIRDARIIKAGNKTNKAATAMATPASQNTQNAAPDKQKMETTTRNYGITAGMQALQAIELIIRQSEYITNQSAVKVDETTNKFVPNPGANKGPIDWFFIEQHVTPLGYDDVRNDYAYEIEYIIKPYKIRDMFSPYFYVPPFPGVHKSYPYWFTGKNTAVLNYEADFDKSFFVQVTGDPSSPLQKSQQIAIRNMRDMIRLQVAAASGETRQGAEGRANEITSNAADYLYSAYNNGTLEMRIIGDPAWMPQGEYSGLKTIKTTGTYAQPFLDDGTINFQIGQVLLEIVWQRPDYYNLATGLQDPYAATESKYGREPRQSVVYMARHVKSYFRGGKFEQEISGVFYPFSMPSGANAVATKPPNTINEDEVNDMDNGMGETTTGETELQAREDARETSLANILLPQTNGALPQPPVDLQPPVGSIGGTFMDESSGVVDKLPSWVGNAASSVQSFFSGPPKAVNRFSGLAGVDDEATELPQPTTQNQVMARDT